MNFRFAAPGGAAALDEPGSEPVSGGARYTDVVRGRANRQPARSLHARRSTCPKVFEAFGSTEFWGLRMSPGLVGTDAARRHPAAGQRAALLHARHDAWRRARRIRAVQPAAGRCALPQNPNPMADTTRALTAALVDWVVKGTAPPPSRYPTLAKGSWLPPTRRPQGSRRFPGLPIRSASTPCSTTTSVPAFSANDMSGVMSKQPPAITRR